jgi:hypothetical protein
MDMMYLPTHHGAKADFYRAFRDALLVMDGGKLKEVEDVLRGKDLTEKQIEDMKKYNFDFFSWRVPRVAPPPHIMGPAVEAVFNQFGHIKDAKTGDPLFNAAAREKATSILAHIAEGCVSDVPGVQLYFEMGKDRDGLTLYRCGRGTNGTENVHQKIMMIFGSFHASPPFADALLAEHRHLSNCRAAIRNRTGVRDFGHYDLYIIEDIQAISEDLYGSPDYASHCSVASFANTGEQFGVGPVHIFDALFKELPATEGIKLPPAAAFLAERMGMSIPPLPVKTEAEIQLFTRLLRDASVLSGSSLKAATMAEEWNKNVDGKTIFPKTPSLLQNYFSSIWKRNLNLRATTADGKSVRDKSLSAIHGDLRDLLDCSFVAGEACELLIKPSARIGQEHRFSNALPDLRPNVSLKRSAAAQAAPPVVPVLPVTAAPAPPPVLRIPVTAAATSTVSALATPTSTSGTSRVRKRPRKADTAAPPASPAPALPLFPFSFGAYYSNPGFLPLPLPAAADEPALKKKKKKTCFCCGAQTGCPGLSRSREHCPHYDATKHAK